MCSFQQQQKLWYKEIVKCDPYSGKEIVNRNYPWEGSEVELSRQILQIALQICSQSKGNHV